LDPIEVTISWSVFLKTLISIRLQKEGHEHLDDVGESKLSGDFTSEVDTQNSPRMLCTNSASGVSGFPVVCRHWDWEITTSVVLENKQKSLIFALVWRL